MDKTISITFNYKELISLDLMLSDKIIEILEFNKNNKIKNKSFLNHYLNLKSRTEKYLSIIEKQQKDILTPNINKAKPTKQILLERSKNENTN